MNELARCVASTLVFAIVSLSVASQAQAETPYGPQGTLGPAGATVRTCNGIPNCFVVSPSMAWESAIESALPGDTVLLRAGSYDPSGSLYVPTGSQAQPITVANYNRETVRIYGAIRFGRGHVVLEGLHVDSGEDSGYTILMESRTNNSVSNIRIKNTDILGGRTEAIRIRGNVQDVTIENSLLDGGRDNHVVKIRCDDTGSCSRIPENILVTNNEFSKRRSSFFPKDNCCDEAVGGSGDLLQLQGSGDVTISYNYFGGNDYEDCVDNKGQGRDGAVTIFSHNIIDSTHDKEFPSTYSGCRQEGMLMHGNQRGPVIIEGNYFVGGANRLRVTNLETVVQNNIFSDTQVVLAGHDFTFAHNTFLRGTLTMGDSSSKPDGPGLINNIFAGTSFQHTGGSYDVVNNIKYGTSGALGSCAACFETGTISADPQLSGFMIAETSPAIDAADEEVVVEVDIRGVLRPQEFGPDIGAIEFSAAGEFPEEESSPPPDEEPLPIEQPAFANNAVPGLVEAENYNVGGEGIGYHDSDKGNNGGAYRQDDVDIKSNVYDGGYSVGWLRAGEWLEYTIVAAEDGLYSVDAYVGTVQSNGPSFSVFVDGEYYTSTVVPNTGSWDVKEWVALPDIDLAAGAHILRIVIDQHWLDIDALKFELISETQDTTPPEITIITAEVVGSHEAAIHWKTDEPADGQIEYGTTDEYGLQKSLDSEQVESHTMNLTGLQPGTLYHYRVKSRDAAGNLAVSSDQTVTTLPDETPPAPSEPPPPIEPPPPSEQPPFGNNAVPGLVEAENYNIGGEGIGYHDSNRGNKGGGYRQDDVDIKPNVYDEGYSVGWLQAGEWLEYTIVVAEDGLYSVEAYVGTVQSNGPSFSVYVDEEYYTSTVVPNTESWDVKEWVALPDIELAAGTHILRIEIDQQWLDIDTLKFELASN